MIKSIMQLKHFVLLLDSPANTPHCWVVQEVELNGNLKVIAMKKAKIYTVPEYLDGMLVGFLYKGSKEEALKKIDDLKMMQTISSVFDPYTNTYV